MRVWKLSSNQGHEFVLKVPITNTFLNGIIIDGNTGPGNVESGKGLRDHRIKSQGCIFIYENLKCGKV